MSASSNKKRSPALVICLVCVALLVAVGLYASDYSRADALALEAMSRAEAVSGEYAFGEEGSRVGLILYPGGKVEYTAYAPLAEEIADKAGVLCVVPDMPLNLAVLDSGAAADVTARYPDIERWYVGGHSLGGAMAASYAAEHPDEIAGVVLLAAYPTEALDIPVLSVYGDKDTVLNAEKYDESRPLAVDLTEVTIMGGNHAQFGDYGAQEGDTPAEITAAEQRSKTAEAVSAWLERAA